MEELLSLTNQGRHFQNIIATLTTFLDNLLQTTLPDTATYDDLVILTARHHKQLDAAAQKKVICYIQALDGIQSPLIRMLKTFGVNDDWKVVLLGFPDTGILEHLDSAFCTVDLLRSDTAVDSRTWYPCRGRKNRRTSPQQRTPEYLPTCRPTLCACIELSDVMKICLVT